MKDMNTLYHIHKSTLLMLCRKDFAEYTDISKINYLYLTPELDDIHFVISRYNVCEECVKEFKRNQIIYELESEINDNSHSR